MICSMLDCIKPKVGKSYAEQITFVKDRPGHDKRYAIDTKKIHSALNWVAIESFESGKK